MSSNKLQQSLQTGAHAELLNLVGAWEGSTKTWFGPGDPTDISAMSGTIKPLFDGRFVMHEYKGSLEGKSFEGIAIYGYNLQAQQFQCSWIDTFHMGTGIMFSHGETSAPFFSVLGQYSSYGEAPETWGWRTEIKVVDDNNITIIAYNISPAGEEFIATETSYQRKEN